MANSRYANEILTLFNFLSNPNVKFKLIKDKRPAYWPRELVIKAMEEMGVACWKSPHAWGQLFQNLLLTADVIKTIPVFSKLEIEDQVIYIYKKNSKGRK